MFQDNSCLRFLVWPVLWWPWLSPSVPTLLKWHVCQCHTRRHVISCTPATQCDNRLTLQPSAEDDADGTGYHRREETIHLCDALVGQMCWMLILQPALVHLLWSRVADKAWDVLVQLHWENSYGPQQPSFSPSRRWFLRQFLRSLGNKHCTDH